MFPRKAAAPRSPKVKRAVFYKYRQDPWKSCEKQPGRSSIPRSGCFCNNKIVKRDLLLVYLSYLTHKLHGHLTGFQDFILVVNCERLSEFLMSIGTIFQIFGAKDLTHRQLYILVLIQNLFVKESRSWYSLD